MALYFEEGGSNWLQIPTVRAASSPQLILIFTESVTDFWLQIGLDVASVS